MPGYLANFLLPIGLCLGSILTKATNNSNVRQVVVAQGEKRDAVALTISMLIIVYCSLIISDNNCKVSGALGEAYALMPTHVSPLLLQYTLRLPRLRSLWLVRFQKSSALKPRKNRAGAVNRDSNSHRHVQIRAKPRQGPSDHSACRCLGV